MPADSSTSLSDEINRKQMQSFMQLLKACTPLSTSVRRSVMLSAYRGSSTRYIGRCPFHNDVRPTLIIDDQKGQYFCQGCGAKGDLLAWLTKGPRRYFEEDAVLQLAYEAIQRIADGAGWKVEISDGNLPAWRKPKEKNPEVPLTGPVDIDAEIPF